jgi:hypothetical protein
MLALWWGLLMGISLSCLWPALRTVRHCACMQSTVRVLEGGRKG